MNALHSNTCANCNGPLRCPTYRVKGIDAEYCSRACLGAKHPQFATITKEGENMKTKKSKTAKATKITKAAKTKKAAPAGSTKGATILELLRRKDGATLTELMKATGWQAHSVRGFLAGNVRKKMGLDLSSTKREDGQRVYQVAA